MAASNDNSNLAWGIHKGGGLDALEEVHAPKPKIERPRDLLVKVHAAALNPVDFKARECYKLVGPPAWISTPSLPAPRILGWDAAGVVEEVGSETSLFKIGDEVYFSGDITRQGSIAHYVVVDERIVGRKPKSLTWEQAAAEPLTTLTAWEGLIEKLNIPILESAPASPKTLLVVAGAGGVGTSVILIAKKLLKLTVIATATRPETVKLCKDLGADHVISHREPLKPQLDALGFDKGVHYIFNAWEASEHWSQFPEIIHPGGRIVIITTPEELPMKAFMAKGVSVSWELMFTRAVFDWEPEHQHDILNKVADLLDNGVFVPRMTEKFAWKEVPQAMKKVEEGKALGKISITVIDQ